MNWRFFTTLAVLATFAVLAGCSGAPDPASPSLAEMDSVRSSDSSGRVLWGLWHVAIDSETGQAEVMPLRSAAFNCNVTQFLHPPFAPINQMIIAINPESDLPNGYVEVDVTFNHPFPGLNQYRGFDVRGIFLADGTHEGDFDPTLRWSDGDFEEPYMLNADGYTRWWNAPEFHDNFPLFSFHPGKLGGNMMPSATLNPYKYYSDDIDYDMDVADMDTSQRGVFSPNALTHKRLYKIQFPVDGGPQFLFNYAVDASWDEPDPDAEPDFPIEAFSKSAQCQEAYHLSVNTDESTLWYDTGTSGGEMHIEVEVFDWQGLTNPDGVPGEVESIIVESIILESPIDVYPSASSYEGCATTSSVFETDIDSANFIIDAPGEYELLITVHSADPNTYQPQLEGGEMFIYPDAPLAAYKFSSVNVINEQPYEPALDVTGDLVLAIERNTNQTITGVELDWTENTNPSPYYAIYADTDPYDGITIDTYVAEVDTDVAVVDDVLWPDFSTNGGYVFAVKGRTVSGMAASDSPNFSEYAFVEMEDFDGGENPGEWVLGYRDSNYKWELQSGGMIDGSTSIRHNPYCPADQWSAYASQVIPSIPDSDQGILEFAHIASNNGTEAAYKAYMGGHTKNGSAPPIGTMSYGDLDNQDPNSVMDGTFQYDNPEPYIGLIALGPFRASGDGWERGWKFNSGPHGVAQITRIDKPHFLTLAGITRAAVGWGRSQYWIYHVEWCEMDEIAVVVY